MPLNLSQNYRLDVHIYFTYLLFRSKEIVYLCQEKKVKYQHTLGKKINTPLLQHSAEPAAQTLMRKCGSSLLWCVLSCYLTVLS